MDPWFVARDDNHGVGQGIIKYLVMEKLFHFVFDSGFFGLVAFVVFI